MHFVQLPKDLVLIDLEECLRGEADALGKEKARRVRMAKELRNEDERVCGRLATKTLFVSREEVPTEQQLSALEDHVIQMERKLVTSPTAQLALQVHRTYH